MVSVRKHSGQGPSLGWGFQRRDIAKAVVVARDEGLAIRRESYAIGAELDLFAEGCFAVRQVPHIQIAAVTAGGQRGAVARKGHSVDIIRRGPYFLGLHAAGHTPDANESVEADGN